MAMLTTRMRRRARVALAGAATLSIGLVGVAHAAPANGTGTAATEATVVSSSWPIGEATVLFDSAAATTDPAIAPAEAVASAVPLTVVPEPASPLPVHEARSTGALVTDSGEALDLSIATDLGASGTVHPRDLSAQVGADGPTSSLASTLTEVDLFAGLLSIAEGEGAATAGAAPDATSTSRSLSIDEAELMPAQQLLELGFLLTLWYAQELDPKAVEAPTLDPEDLQRATPGLLVFDVQPETPVVGVSGVELQVSTTAAAGVADSEAIATGTIESLRVFGEEIGPLDLSDPAAVAAAQATANEIVDGVVEQFFALVGGLGSFPGWLPPLDTDAIIDLTILGAETSVDQLEDTTVADASLGVVSLDVSFPVEWLFLLLTGPVDTVLRSPGIEGCVLDGPETPAVVSEVTDGPDPCEGEPVELETADVATTVGALHARSDFTATPVLAAPAGPITPTARVEGIDTSRPQLPATGGESGPVLLLAGLLVTGAVGVRRIIRPVDTTRTRRS